MKVMKVMAERAWWRVSPVGMPQVYWMQPQESRAVHFRNQKHFVLSSVFFVSVFAGGPQSGVDDGDRINARWCA